jgi:hypothetical protein
MVATVRSVSPDHTHRVVGVVLTKKGCKSFFFFFFFFCFGVVILDLSHKVREVHKSHARVALLLKKSNSFEIKAYNLK